MAFVYKQDRKLNLSPLPNQLQHLSQDQLCMLQKIFLKQLTQQQKIGNIHSIIPHNLLRKIRLQFFTSKQAIPAYQQQKHIKPLVKIQYTPISYMHPKIRKYLRNFSQQNLKRLRKLVDETEQKEKQLPELKSTLTDKTLVLYHQSNIKKEQKQQDATPGPGQYDIIVQSNVKGILPFQNNRCSRLITQQEQSQTSKYSPQEQTYLPNYKTCVSPIFREKIPNKNYLSQMANLYFRKPSKKIDNISENDNDQIQYIRKTISPGPGSYYVEQKIKCQSRSHHKISSPSMCILPKILNCNRNSRVGLIAPQAPKYEQNNKKTIFCLKKIPGPPFMSSLDKNQKVKTEINEILQNTDYTFSMLEKTNPFSRGKFGSNAKRFIYKEKQQLSLIQNKKNKSDNSEKRKVIFKGPILNLTEKRNHFWLNNKQNISSQTVPIEDNNIENKDKKKQHLKHSLKRKNRKLSEQNKEEARIILTNPSLLKKIYEIQDIKKNMHSIFNFRSKLKKPEFRIVENQIIGQQKPKTQFYNSQASWQINSFNKNFSNKCLKKNNPIQK